MFFVDSPMQRRQGIRDSAELALRDWFGRFPLNEKLRFLTFAAVRRIGG
jgi:predicted oxidoreductase